MLAGLETIKYKQKELFLEPGDRLLLYTDGITEATDSNNALYGEERLKSFMNSHQSLKPDEMLRGIKTDIDGFVGEASQFDDMTMLMLDYRKQMEV